MGSAVVFRAMVVKPLLLLLLALLQVTLCLSPFRRRGLNCLLLPPERTAYNCCNNTR